MTTAEQSVVALAESGITATVAESFGPDALDVPVEAWLPAHEVLRDDLGLIYFDWLTAADELAEGFRIVTHLADFWGGGNVEHLLVRTLVPRAAPRLTSLTPVYAGANWHERETFEMFGVEFEGHPNLVPLLLPDGFEGNPLRKEFVLASRVAKPWPGAKEPGESEHAPKAGAPSRRRMLPPGVPDAETWGPRPPGSPDPDPLAAAQASAAPARGRRSPGERRPPGERRTPRGRTAEGSAEGRPPAESGSTGETPGAGEPAGETPG